MEYSGASLIAISVSYLFLNTFFVGLRFYTRFACKKVTFGLDDATILLAYLFCMGMCGIGLVFVYVAHAGYHTSYALKLDPDTMVRWAKATFALELIYLTALSLSKLAILTLYRRVFVCGREAIAINVMIVVVVLYWVAYFIPIFCQCVPLDALWDKSVKGAHCFNEEAFFKTVSITGAVVDIPILLLPIPNVARMQVPTSRKVGLICIFLCGILGITACIIRGVTFFLHDAFSDPIWTSIYLVGTSVIEPSMYLISCCLMTLKPLLDRLVNCASSLSKRLAKKCSSNS